MKKKYPSSIVHAGETYYIQSTGCYYQHGDTRLRERLLHRRIWISRRGPIPKGWDVHHKNGDWTDNRMKNMRIMPQSKHRRMHMKRKLKNPHYYNQCLGYLKKGREAAKEWHRSEEGRKWHREHAKHSLRLTPKKKRKCIYCGHEWMTTYHKAKFCSRSCSQTYYEKYTARKEKRKCQHCGGSFLIPFMKKTRFCSPQCTAWGVAKIKAAKKALKNGTH